MLMIIMRMMWVFATVMSSLYQSWSFVASFLTTWTHWWTTILHTSMTTNPIVKSQKYVPLLVENTISYKRIVGSIPNCVKSFKIYGAPLKFCSSWGAVDLAAMGSWRRGTIRVFLFLCHCGMLQWPAGLLQMSEKIIPLPHKNCNK